MGFNRLVATEVKDGDILLLAQPVQTANPLLDTHGIPGQIVVDQLVAKLEIAPFRAALCADQHTDIAFEGRHRRFFLVDIQPTVEASRGDPPHRQLLHNLVEGVAIFGKDQELAGELLQDLFDGKELAPNRDRLGQREEARQLAVRARPMRAISHHLPQRRRHCLRAAAQLALQNHQREPQKFVAVNGPKAAADIVGHFGVKLPLRLTQRQVIDRRLPFGELNIDLAAPVADHHIAEQPAQGARVLGLTGIGLFEKVAPEGAHRTQLTGGQNGDQAVKLHQIILNGGGGEQEHIALTNLVDKLPGQRIAILELVRFVDHQQIKLATEDRIALVFEFGAVNADDPAPFLVARYLFPLCPRLHHRKRFVELAIEFLAPLFGQRSRGQDQHRAHQPAHDQLFHDDARFDRLAQPDLVGQQGAATHIA